MSILDQRDEESLSRSLISLAGIVKVALKELKRGDVCSLADPTSGRRVGLTRGARTAIGAKCDGRCEQGMEVGKRANERGGERRKRQRERRRRPRGEEATHERPFVPTPQPLQSPQVMVALRPAGSCFERSTHAAIVDDVV